MFSNRERLDSSYYGLDSPTTTSGNIEKLIQKCKYIATSIFSDTKSKLSDKAAESVIELEKIYTNILNLNNK